ncbi:hypothetical protein IAR50_002154 [Cryptococcus sp. DSM 104548]
MAPPSPLANRTTVHPFFSSKQQQPSSDSTPTQAKPTNALPKRKRASGAANAKAGPTQATLGLSNKHDGNRALVVEKKAPQPVVVGAEASQPATEVSSSSDEDEDVIFSHSSQAGPSSSQSIDARKDTKKPKPKRSRPSVPLSNQPSSSSLASEIIDISSGAEDENEPTPRSKPKSLHGSHQPSIFHKGLARTSSWTGSAGTNADAAIEVPEGSPSPAKKDKPSAKKMASTVDKNKPTHSFFSQVRSRAKGDDGAGPSLLAGGGETPSGAVGVPCDTTNGTNPKRNNVVHAFFSLQQEKNKWKLKEGWGMEEVETPLPQGLWPSHVGGSYSGSKEPVRASRFNKAEPAQQGDFWDDMLSRVYKPSTPITRRFEPIHILPFISQHPAFASLPLKAASSAANRDAWVDRYGPQRVAEVLGNELEATYLRDWLSTLAIGHHHEGRNIIRKVVKRPGAALKDDFIVDDLGVYGDAFNEDEDDEQIHLDDLEKPPISCDLTARPAEYPSLEARLTNTILLAGKHGSGKSATVHAAAKELGWEVFEVYPGMGKRSGGALMGWLGDLGRNHIVPQEDKRQMVMNHEKRNGKEKEKEKAGGLKSFLDKSSTSNPKARPSSSNRERLEDIIDYTADDIETRGKNAAGNTERNFKQSLILIDEADVLFEEEATFWPGVIALVAESRRPVVLTCNDHNRIPLAQLPLQAILQFQPPPSHIAMPYLQALSDVEGDRRGSPLAVDVATIYKLAMREQHESGLQEDGPVLPNGHERVPYFDLRQAIGQMQLGLQPGMVEEVEGVDESDDDLKLLFQRMDAQSYADVAGPKPWAMMDMVDIDRLEKTPDDELDVAALRKHALPETYPILASCDRSLAIISTVVSMSGGGLSPMGDLGLARTKYIRSTLPILDPLIPLSAPLLPSPSIFLHTLPTIHHILQIDDLYEEIVEKAIERGEELINPKTGKPMRRGQVRAYARYFDLEGAEEAVGDISRLRLNW